MPDRLDALVECYRLLEETGDLEACRERFPELVDELLEDLRLQAELSASAGPAPRPEAIAAAKLRVLRALEESRRRDEDTSET